MKNLCWVRRDLRLHDHHALSKALAQGETTLVFVFDTHILNKLHEKKDRRITFIIQSLQEMEKELQKKGSSLVIRYGKPEEEIPKLAQELSIKKVFTNRDYEPYAKARDLEVAKKLQSMGVEFESFKDSVFYEQHEVLTGSDTIYKVFTPYKNKWIQKFESQDRMVSNFEPKLSNVSKLKNPKNILEFDWYKTIGFEEDLPLLTGGTSEAKKRLKHFLDHISQYKDARNFPSIDGTSLLSVHIRFGTISIRDLIRASLTERSDGARTWLSELIWREFYFVILDTHPHIVKRAFKEPYDKIQWLGKKEDFEAWTRGETGYPLVDAAMRCLNQTGLMHNRLRMVVASFMCKILLIDWRLGEEYFAEKLLDYDLAANNGGWQWSSSSGCDAQPYFRIFNPYTQSQKFDSEGEFIRQWIPEIAHLSDSEVHRPDVLVVKDYPAPVVNYEKNRIRCLDMYACVKAK